MRTKSDSGNENGSTLLLILVFLTAIGVLGAALMNYELTLNKQSFSTRRIQTRETGVNTGLDWAVSSIKQGKDGFCQGGYDRDLLSIGGREVEVVCRVDDPAERSTNNVALFLSRSEPAERNRLVTSGALGPDGATQIVGPVYVDGIQEWALDTPIRIDGDVHVGTKDGRCESNETTDLPKNVVALYPNARNCSMTIAAVTPSEVRPPCEAIEACVDPKPRLLDVKGNETATAPACKVFSPGVYRTAPELAGNNFFSPGTYYFELEEEWRIATALRGGDPAPDSAVSVASPTVSTVPRCAGAPEPVAPWGVTFVVGGRSTLRVLDAARVELFGNSTSAASLPNIVAGGQKGTTDWALRSAFNLERNLLTVGPGAPEFILHEGVFAPDSGVSMSGTRDAVETVGATVVVGRLELRGDGVDRPDGGSASAVAAVAVEVAPAEGNDAPSRVRSNIGIFARPGTAKKFVLMARSCPGGRDVITRDACSNPPAGAREPEVCAIASATVYDDDRRTVYIDNWRVDRDPSQADPADCTLTSRL